MYHEQYIQNSCNTVLSRDMVCFRKIRVNTLHKGDDDDDDNDDRIQAHCCCVHNLLIVHSILLPNSKPYNTDPSVLRILRTSNVAM